jgi:acetoin utilization protein AcuB
MGRGRFFMIVEEIMQTTIITLSPEDTIFKAHQLMLRHRVRHLPIVNENREILGIVSDRNIRDAAPSILTDAAEQKHLLETPISTIMTTEVITGHPLDFVEEIGSIFYEHHISCLPIENHGKLVGIITETDLLYTLIQLSGANQPGSQIEIVAPNRAGVLNDITNTFRKRRANILSVLIYPDKHDDQNKIIVIRVQTMNPIRLIEDLETSGYRVLWPNLPGIEL